jgi:capsular exopolysaccharide synthesis family protein
LGVEIKEVVRTLRRRKGIILSSVMLLTSLAVLAGLQVTPKYTASALVMIDPRKSNVVDVESVIQGLGTDASTVESQIRVIGSRFQLERLAAELRVFEDPEFNVALRNSARMLPLGVTGPLKGLLEWVPNAWLVASGLAAEPLALAEGEVLLLQHEAAMEAFSRQFKVTPEGRSYVIKLTFTSEDASKSARVVNGAAGLYVKALREEKVERTERATKWLSRRLDELRHEVEVAEDAVEQYRISKGITEAQGVPLNEQRLFDLNKTLASLRADHAAMQAKLGQIRDMRSGGLRALEAVPEVLSSATIINLRERETQLLKEESDLRSTFGTRHPRILSLQQEKITLQRKIQAEVERIIKTIENQGEVAASRIKALEVELQSVAGGTTVDRAVAVKLRELERDADASRNLYNAFLQRYKETAEQRDIVEADAKVVSMATPPSKPSTPGAKLFGAVGFATSLMLGTFLALLVERFDTGLRSAKQVQQAVGLPLLGLVPRLKRLKRNQRPHCFVIGKPLSAYTESIRSIRTSLELTDPDDPPKVVLVTSSLPQEGKTTLSLSLAIFAANSGQRVLLLDADLRHPSVHRELGAAPAQGLVELIAGEKELDDVLVRSEETGIWHLPVKRQTTNPTDLLGSQRMRLLFAELRRRFDFVVVDSAPVLGVTDTKVVSRLADRVLFVTQWDKTGKDTALNALAHLREAKAHVAGVVLSQVDVRRHAQYGYCDVGQYYSKYHKYYVN